MKYVILFKDKNIKINEKINYYQDPDYIYIPLYNKELLVSKSVCIGNIVCKDIDLIRSSVSGEVNNIKKCIVDNKELDCLVVKNDFKEKKKKNKYSFKGYELNEIIKKIEEFGLYNLKDKLSNNSYENIVINTIDDGAYEKRRVILFKENINDLLELIDALSIIYSTKNNCIAIKSSESNGIDKCLNKIRTYPNIKVDLTKDYYLLGNYYFLNKYLELDNKSTLNLDIDELLNIINIMKYNELDSSRLITISGDALSEGKVIIAKKYTLVSDIIDKYYKELDNVEYYVNGLLRGTKKNIDNIVLTDNINSIHIMRKKNIKKYECIKCGECYNICPLKINPVKSMISKRVNKNCIGCGLCNYICPSNIDLKGYLKGDKDAQ